MRLFMIALLSFLSLSLSTLVSTPVLAADLDKAKASGQLGEQLDGYLGVVDVSTPPDVKEMMQEINAKRQAKYAEIAASRGVSVEAVAKIAAKKVYESSPAGIYFLDSTGQWKQK